MGSEMCIRDSALDFEWKLFERQEKQIQQLTTLSLSIVSLYPSLHRLAFHDDWNSWQIFSVAGTEICLIVGLINALQVFKLKDLVSQAPVGLKQAVEDESHWSSSELARDRAYLVSKIIISLAERRAYIAHQQQKIVYCIFGAVTFILQSFIAGLVK